MNGASPHAVGEMSLYEILSMVGAWERLTPGKTTPVAATAEEMEATRNMLRRMAENDPSMRID